MALWVKLDVEYASDPKLIDAGPMAELLYVRALCFAKKVNRDGFIEYRQLTRLAVGLPRPGALAVRLVQSGAFVETDNGWQITGWLKHNKTAHRIADETERKRLKSLLGNHKRWHFERSEYDPTCELCNPYNDPHSDPHGDPGKESIEQRSTSTSTSTSTSEEPSSSVVTPLAVVPNRVDDDDFVRTLGLIADARMVGRTPTNPRGYRQAIITEARKLDGDVIRRMLTDGDPPEVVALFVLGYGDSTRDERPMTPSIPWCGTDCPSCDGTAWIDTGNGLAPCPERRTA
jgi:hypothetical protein